MKAEDAILRSLDLIFASMRPGEEAKVTIEPGYGYGMNGQRNIPPDSILLYDVKLESFVYNLPMVL